MRDPSPQRQGTAVEDRRGSRQVVAVPVIVSGRLARGTCFAQKTRVDVSEDGARLHLQTCLPVGTAVMVENLATSERLLFRVVRVAEHTRGGYEIGLEAPDPPPDFWRLRWDAPA